MISRGRGKGKGKGRGTRPRKSRRGPSAGRRPPRPCRFCSDHQLEIDYKNVDMLRNFVTERYKIVSGRQSRICAWHQRKIRQAVKRARAMALLPYTISKRLPTEHLSA